MPCVTSCVWCNIAQLLFLVAHISATFSDAITTSELIVALSSNLLSHGLNNVACAIQVSCVKRQKWEVGVERWHVSNLIPVACSLRTAVPGAIVRPHKYGNCCEKEGQLLSVGVVYYLRVISDFPWQLFTPRVLCFSLPPFLPAPEKLLLFVMMFCLPAASAHSLPPPTHKPCPLNLLFFDHNAEKNLVPVSISSPVTPQATKENHFHFFYSILHFHLSIRAKLSQGLLFIWLYISWCHLNHCLVVSL